MKKLLLSTSLLLVCFLGNSQVKVGLRLAPNLSFNSVVDKDQDDLKNLHSNSVGARYSIGPFADIYMGDNFAIHTGLMFTPKRIGLSDTIIDPNNGLVVKNAITTMNIQYLQIPFAIKLFTNEIATDLQIYFSLGGTLDIKIAQKFIKDDLKIEEKLEQDGKNYLFFPIDAGLLMAVGIEKRIGTSNSFFLGLSYNRGLSNIINPNYRDYHDYYKFKTSLLALEAGIKF